MNTMSDIPPEHFDIPIDEREQSYEPLVNLEAESAVLGTLLMDSRAMERVEDILEPHHFAFTGHARLFEMCKTAIQDGGTADAITIKQKLELSGDFERFGGDEWLAGVVTSAMGAMSAQGHAHVIRDLFYRRELSSLAQSMLHRAVNVDGEAKDLVEGIEKELSELMGDSVGEEARSRHDVVMDVLRSIESRKKNPGQLLGLSTGLTQLDRILRGLRDTDLLILAGRPSMGKTALVLCIAHAIARQYQKTGGEEGAPVLFFSLEMSADQMIERQISANANVPADALETGKYHDDKQFLDVVETAQDLINMPLYIDERSGMTVAQMKAHARRMKRMYGIGLIVVDYLQLINTPGGRSDGRVNDVSAMTRELKIMAKDLGVPVIALSQLSRAVEQRDPPIPRLSDLRDSGSIEQDADVVMFVYRDEYYLERKEPKQRTDESASKFAERMLAWQDQMAAAKGVADILVEKNRKGRVGKARTAFHGSYTRFSNLDDTHTSNPQEDMM